MAGQVEGKVALVTGGASGIGEAIVELFAREGATVIATDIDELRGPELAKRITKAGGKAIFLEQDVTSEERWIEIVADIAKRYGRLDIMVSNAGIGIAVPSIVDMTLSDWRKQNAINLDGVFLSVKHCLPLMRKHGGGSIVMMSSLAGLRGAPGLSAYSATKGGVRLFAKSIAMECAAARRHPCQLRASRHHRHADLGQDPDRGDGRRSERADRSRGARQGRNPAWSRRPGRGYRLRRAVSGLGCLALRHRQRARHRRRHECRRRAAAGVRRAGQGGCRRG